MTLERQVLRWVNGCRRELGLKPLRVLLSGEISSAYGCPLARSLAHGGKSVSVNGTSATTYREAWVRGKWGDEIAQVMDRVFVLPKNIREFLNEFDNGKHSAFERQHNILY